MCAKVVISSDIKKKSCAFLVFLIQKWLQGFVRNNEAIKDVSSINYLLFGFVKILLSSYILSQSLYIDAFFAHVLKVVYESTILWPSRG